MLSVSDGQHGAGGGGLGVIATRSISSQEGWKLWTCSVFYTCVCVCVCLVLGINTLILSKARRALISAHTSYHACVITSPAMTCIHTHSWTHRNTVDVFVFVFMSKPFVTVTLNDSIGWVLMLLFTMHNKNSNRNWWWLNLNLIIMVCMILPSRMLKVYIYKGYIYCTLVRWFWA